jgi:hypothetical protein
MSLKLNDKNKETIRQVFNLKANKVIFKPNHNILKFKPFFFMQNSKPVLGW